MTEEPEDEKSYIHINIPKWDIIKEYKDFKDSDMGIINRFGRRVIETDCCFRNRDIRNVIFKHQDWYGWYIFCKEGKGCKGPYEKKKRRKCVHLMRENRII